MQDRFRLVVGKTHLSRKNDSIHRLIYANSLSIYTRILLAHMSNGLSYQRFFSIPSPVIGCICFQAAPLREWLVVRLGRTMRMGGIALKMGVLFERSEFRPFSNDGHSQRNGSFGRPPFAMPKRFARNQRFRLSAYLRLFFFGGSKKNGHTRVRGILSLYSGRTERKSI